MASLLRNIARKNFVNFLEVLDARRLVSFRQTFIKGDNALRVLNHLWAFIDPHKRESHRKQRRNFRYTLFAVLGIAAATSYGRRLSAHIIRQSEPLCYYSFAPGKG